MSEEIILFYPPEPIVIDFENTNKKELEINLYNKTNNKVLYKIICNNQNIFKIKNPISIIKPLASTSIIISIAFEIKKNININKFEIIFNFYELNNSDDKNCVDLNTILNNKIGKENQKSSKNIYFSKNKETIINKDINKYTKFKNDLKEINNKINNIINSKNLAFNKNKNVFFVVAFLLLLIICLGFFFGFKLSRKYNKLFKKNINKNSISNNKKEEDYVEIKFMSVKEADEINEVSDENMKKFKELNNFNILNEVKKNRILKENLEKIKKEKNFALHCYIGQILDEDFPELIELLEKYRNSDDWELWSILGGYVGDMIDKKLYREGKTRPRRLIGAHPTDCLKLPRLRPFYCYEFEILRRDRNELKEAYDTLITNNFEEFNKIFVKLVKAKKVYFAPKTPIE